MPANLTPEYRDAERAYREARTPGEKLVCLKEMLRVIPKHKGSEHLQADLKKRISKLKADLEGGAGRKKKATSHMVHREGAGQVALVGPPNGGKSSLVRALTHADPVVAPYPYCTQRPEPGMMPVGDVQVQLVDLPPVSTEHTEMFVYDCIRAADAVALVIGIDAVAPDVDLKTTIELLEQRFIQPVPGGSTDVPRIDFRVKQLPAVVVLNKMDRDDQGVRELLGDMISTAIATSVVSAESGLGLDQLGTALFGLLRVIRVYTKEPGKPPDMEAPFVLPERSTVADLATKIHKDIARNLKSARVWGSTKFAGQAVHGEFELHDRDVVELHW